MMAGLAHESRNALQRTHACLELLQLKAEDRPDLLDLTADIEKAQDHLRYLFDEVRGYAAPIRLKPEPVDLGKLLRETWQQLHQTRKGREARLVEAVVPFNLVCRADPVALGQVFRNILENSLSMCADPVIIQVQWAQVMYKSGHAIQAKLRDNGPGFSPEARARVFEPFFTTKIQGTGLGMAIAKRIVEAHGGEIAIGASQPPGAEIQLTVLRDGP
jgi:two-component system, LuxR family, sensor kinase FixL